MPRAGDPRGNRRSPLLGEKKKVPKFFFLSETRLDIDGFFCSLKKKLELTTGFAVPKIGLGGGLALLWEDSVDLDIQTFFSHITWML